MASQEKSESSALQSDSNMVTEKQIELKISTRDTLTVNQGNATGNHELLESENELRNN